MSLSGRARSERGVTCRESLLVTRKRQHALAVGGAVLLCSFEVTLRANQKSESSATSTGRIQGWILCNQRETRRSETRDCRQES